MSEERSAPRRTLWFWMEGGTLSLLLFATQEIFFQMRDEPDWSFLRSSDLLVSALIFYGAFGLFAWISSRRRGGE